MLSITIGRWLTRAALVFLGTLAIVGCQNDEPVNGERPIQPDAGLDGSSSDGSSSDGSSSDGSSSDGSSSDAVVFDADDAETSDSQAPNCPDGFGGPPTNNAPPIPGNWKLELQEDFLDPGLDDAIWKVGQHWAGISGMAGNDPANIAVSCGYLSLRAENRPFTFCGTLYNYAAAEVSTFKRFRQLYGYFEARIKYDSVTGMWPAFWLMPDHEAYGDVNRNRLSYLKFDLTSETRTSVPSAVLELHVEAAETGTHNVVLVPVENDSWTENTITWNTRPKIDPRWVAIHYDPKWTTGDKATFDITDYVNQQLAGDKVVSLALIDGFMRARRVSFASKEATDSAKHPRMIIAGAPAPAIAVHDASVGEGTAADQNFGNDPLLHVEEQWGDTATTHNGGMEVDIMESLGHWGDHTTSHAMHWDGYGSQHQSTGSGRITIPPSSDGFHVYGLNWQPGRLTFYIDGTKTYEWVNARVGSVASFILLSLQMGGWADDLGDNRVVNDGELPAEMVVDYVRVWSGTPH